MIVTEVLAWLTLLVGVPLNVVAALLLRQKRHEAPNLRVLKERYVVAIVTTVVVAVFGLIFVNNDQTIPPLNVDATKVITRAVLLGLAIIPTLMWLYIYVGRGKKQNGG